MVLQQSYGAIVQGISGEAIGSLRVADGARIEMDGKLCGLETTR